MDLDSLQTQFHGRKFGDLVLEHLNKLDFSATVHALRGITQELPAVAQPLVESWVDDINPHSRVAQFWQQDCGVALMSITTAAAAKLRGVGIEPSSDDLFNMFQIIVLNFVCAGHNHPQSKAFIQKAVSTGFLSRLFRTTPGIQADLYNFAALEKLSVQFAQAQTKYLKLVTDGLADPDVEERKAHARMIADTLAPALVDDSNLATRSRSHKTLKTLIAELRPPKNESEMRDLNNACFFAVRRLLKSTEKQMPTNRNLEVKEHLTRAWNDKELQIRVAARIQRYIPSLLPDLAMKACLGTIAKLVSAIMSGWSREAWEKNVCDMLQNSPPMKFASGEALAICRLVENDLRRFFGWRIEIPDPSEANDNTVYINATTDGIPWLLSRSEDKLVVVGAMLISQFLLSMQRGWAAKGLQPAEIDSRMIGLNLRPCEISDQEALDLARTLRAANSVPTDKRMLPVFQQVETLLTFFEGGKFRIDRAPDAVAQPATESDLVWKP
jgi:hypothetical protein